jgi:hypothetical protein
MDTSTKRPVGRPLLFKDAEELQKAVDAYFKKCDARKVDVITKDGTAIKIKRQEPYTVSGLALALNTSRETLMNYEDKAEFFDTIKAAKDKCLAWVETQLFEGTGAPAGVIFNLKNNYGWVDKTEYEGKSENTNLNQDMSDVSTEDLQARVAALRASQAD